MGVELLSVSRIQAGGFGLLPSLLQAISLQLDVVPASLLLDLVLLWLNPARFEGYLEKQVDFFCASVFACSSISVCCRLISLLISALFTELWCCGDGFSLQERQCCLPRKTIRIFLRKVELKNFHLLFLIDYWYHQMLCWGENPKQSLWFEISVSVLLLFSGTALPHISWFPRLSTLSTAEEWKLMWW